MNILVACEESQACCIELRKLGHTAFSCDVQECSGGHPEWHIHQDVLPLINGNCEFKTTDGSVHKIEGKWDMILAFPPCTHLAISGAPRFEEKRKDGRQREAIEFFCQFLNVDCDKVCIENPVNIINGGKYILTYFPDLAEKYNIPKMYSQQIQQWEFGHNHSKKTCFWLKGLPPLKPTVSEKPEIEYLVWVDKKTGKTKRQDKEYANYSKKDRGKKRSKTPIGLAKAMAEQWAGMNI